MPFLNICSGMREVLVEFSTLRAPSQVITELTGITLGKSLKLKGKLLFFHGRGICWGVITQNPVLTLAHFVLLCYSILPPHSPFQLKSQLLLSSSGNTLALA